MSALKKFSPALKEVRIHLCPHSNTSNPTRQFIEKYYLDMKRNNPNLPILIRECAGVKPKMWFRYEYGREVDKDLTNLNVDQIGQLVKEI